MFVILAKFQQYIERYTEIKVSGLSSLRIPADIPQNHASVEWQCYIVFERASYVHISVTINLYIVEFHIESTRHNYFLMSHEQPGLLCSSSVFPQRTESFITAVYRSCSCMSILISSPVVLAGCKCESQSWRCDRRRSSLMLRISIILNIAHCESQRL